MTDAVIVGEIFVDPESGEVLEIPAGVVDLMEWLALQDLEAVENITGWEQRRAILKAKVKDQLARNGLQSVKTRFGTFRSVDSSTTETGQPDRVPEVVREFELGKEAELAIYQTAKTLDVKGLRALPVTMVPPVAREALIESAPKRGFVKRDPPRAAAPAAR